MKKSFFTIILVIVALFFTDVFAGWVVGTMYREEFCGPPNQYCYYNTWDINAPTKIKLVEPSGWVAVSTSFSPNDGYFYMQHPYNQNITGDKIYAYGYYTDLYGQHEYAGTMIVTSNGGTQDMILRNYIYTHPDNLHGNLGPFGGEAFIYWEWNYGSNYDITSFVIERKVNNGSWTQIATVSANQTDYTDNSVQNGNYYYYRVRSVLTMPHDYHNTYGGYSNGITIAKPEYSVSIGGPSIVNKNQVRTWTADISSSYSGPYSYEWRYKYYIGLPWSAIVSTEPNFSFSSATNFFLYLKVTVGAVSKFTTKSVSIAQEEEEQDIENSQEGGILAYELYQNYPNPFNPSTTIEYSIPQTEFVTLKVYDVLGNVIDDLIGGEQAPGTHNVTFTANNLSSGIYFYSIIAGDFRKTKSFIINK